MSFKPHVFQPANAGLILELWHLPKIKSLCSKGYNQSCVREVSSAISRSPGNPGTAALTVPRIGWCSHTYSQLLQGLKDHTIYHYVHLVCQHLLVWWSLSAISSVSLCALMCLWNNISNLSAFPFRYIDIILYYPPPENSSWLDCLPWFGVRRSL